MKRILSLLFCLSFIMFISCDHILDCVINRRPELPEKSFQEGFVYQFYHQEFDAHIKNEPLDNNYGYNFVIEGELPDGLEMFASYRTLSFEGFPESTGTYKFTIFLYVDPPVSYNEETGEYEDSMCSESTSKEYMIVIN